MNQVDWADDTEIEGEESEHECWEHMQNTAHISTVMCGLCGALFDRFGDDP